MFRFWQVSSIFCLSRLSVNRGSGWLEHVSGLKPRRLERARASDITTLCRVRRWGCAWVGMKIVPESAASRASDGRENVNNKAICHFRCQGATADNHQLTLQPHECSFEGPSSKLCCFASRWSHRGVFFFPFSAKPSCFQWITHKTLWIIKHPVTHRHSWQLTSEHRGIVEQPGDQNTMSWQTAERWPKVWFHFAETIPVPAHGERKRVSAAVALAYTPSSLTSGLNNIRIFYHRHEIRFISLSPPPPVWWPDVERVPRFGRFQTCHRFITSLAWSLWNMPLVSTTKSTGDFPHNLPFVCPLFH